MRCAIWYHLYNLKSVKNTHGGVLILKINTPPWVIFTFLNCTNGTKSRNASYMTLIYTNMALKLIIREMCSS